MSTANEHFDLKKYFSDALEIIESNHYDLIDYINVAEYRVKLLTNSSALRESFFPALAHLKDSDETPKGVAMTLYYADGSKLNRRLQAPPSTIFNAQGFCESVAQDEYQIFYQPWLRQVYIYSQELNIGIYWVLNADEIPWWEKTFSFRIIFHWWSMKLTLQLMHAGAMSVDGKTGWLIPGPSGSGKSTTCMSLLLNNIGYLDDDYVLVKTTAPFMVYCIYNTAKIVPEAFDRGFASLKSKLHNEATYHYEKAVLMIGEHYPKQLIKSVELKGILLPSITKQTITTYSAVSPAKAILSIAPTTLHHLPHNRTASFQKITQLTAKTNSFDWNLGSDPKLLIKSFKDIDETF